jgi:hypothetical protein
MNAMTKEVYGLTVERDPQERLGPDDMASVREAEFLHRALTAAQAALRQAALPRGRCNNCGEACAPTALYCDDDCHADHQRRLAALRHTRGR